MSKKTKKTRTATSGYHGTSVEAAISILDDGFIPTKNLLIDEDGAESKDGRGRVIEGNFVYFAPKGKGLVDALTRRTARSRQGAKEHGEDKARDEVAAAAIDGVEVPLEDRAYALIEANFPERRRRIDHAVDAVAVPESMLGELAIQGVSIISLETGKVLEYIPVGKSPKVMPVPSKVPSPIERG